MSGRTTIAVSGDGQNKTALGAENFESRVGGEVGGSRKGPLEAGIVVDTPGKYHFIDVLPMPERRYDKRKFKYSRLIAMDQPTHSFGATKADRLDAEEAGALLEQIHEKVGLGKASERALYAFDCALFFEHSVNGSSSLQSGEGYLFVGESKYPIQKVLKCLGSRARRFFRAYADEIADNNRRILAAYTPEDDLSVDRYGQLMQVAFERGLQRFPHLVHDSADAMLNASPEERIAIMT